MQVPPLRLFLLVFADELTAFNELGFRIMWAVVAGF